MSILMYHRIADDGPPGLARWRIAPAEFERQMAHLAAAGFRSVGLHEWLAARDNAAAGFSRMVALTFDDAYRDFLTDALPVLKCHGFTATLFVPTGTIGGRAEWDVAYGEPAPLLTFDELGVVADAGIVFGAHTVTHPRLPGLPADRLAAEIGESRRVLEEKFTRPVTTFAYPYGDHDATSRAAVAAAGMPLAVTISQEPLTPLSLPRVEIAGGDSIETFARKVGG